MRRHLKREHPNLTMKQDGEFVSFLNENVQLLKRVTSASVSNRNI